MSKKIVVLAILLVILLLALGGAFYVFYPVLASQSGGGDDSAIPEVRITYENFEAQLMQQSFVRDIPAGGTILLRFYTYATGEQTWENSYILRTGRVERSSTADADIVISMHSKYLDTLTNKNLCATIANAQQNNDVSTESRLSSTGLAWKYRSMARYRECLGLG